MSAPRWLAILIAAVIAPTAHATVGGVAGFNDAVYLFAPAERSQRLVYNYLTPTLPENGNGRLGTVSPYEFENIPGWNLRACKSSNCIRRTVAFGQLFAEPLLLGGSAGGAAVTSASRSDSGAMTALDLALMLLFAAGLLAYQLARKHRVLRQASFVCSVALE
jgi:hypothetical protein